MHNLLWSAMTLYRIFSRTLYEDGVSPVVLKPTTAKLSDYITLVQGTDYMVKVFEEDIRKLRYYCTQISDYSTRLVFIDDKDNIRLTLMCGEIDYISQLTRD